MHLAGKQVFYCAVFSKARDNLAIVFRVRME